MTTKPITVLAIDPGPEESAHVLYRGDCIPTFGKCGNEELLGMLRNYPPWNVPLVIEKIASFGMPVGAEVFETVFWSGRFAEVWKGDFHRITRHQVKMHLCHSARANDGTIRQSIIDRFGGKEKAIGKKSSRGPLYGISGDVWSALAVALTFSDQNSPEAHAAPKHAQPKEPERC